MATAATSVLVKTAPLGAHQPAVAEMVAATSAAAWSQIYDGGQVSTQLA